MSLLQDCDEFLQLRDWFADPLLWHATTGDDYNAPTSARPMNQKERLERKLEFDRNERRLMELVDTLAVGSERHGVECGPLHALAELRTHFAPDTGFEVTPAIAAWREAAHTVERLKNAIVYGRDVILEHALAVHSYKGSFRPKDGFSPELRQAFIDAARRLVEGESKS